LRTGLRAPQEIILQDGTERGADTAVAGRITAGVWPGSWSISFRDTGTHTLRISQRRRPLHRSIVLSPDTICPARRVRARRRDDAAVGHWPERCATIPRPTTTAGPAPCPTIHRAPTSDPKHGRVYASKGTRTGNWQLLPHRLRQAARFVESENANQGNISPALGRPAILLTQLYRHCRHGRTTSWVRKRAESNSVSTLDHIIQQRFTTAVASRRTDIGTASSAESSWQNCPVRREPPRGDGPDHVWVVPAKISFNSRRPGRIRCGFNTQDGAIGDQIGLSPVTYFIHQSSPGRESTRRRFSTDRASSNHQHPATGVRGEPFAAISRTPSYAATEHRDATASAPRAHGPRRRRQLGEL